jgi:hypothetical protein
MRGALGARCARIGGMGDSPPILEYAPARSWWRHPLAWRPLCLGVWAMTMCGTICFGIGAASLVWPELAEGTSLMGRAVETLGERVVWTLATSAVAGAGWVFLARNVKPFVPRRRTSGMEESHIASRMTVRYR